MRCLIIATSAPAPHNFLTMIMIMRMMTIVMVTFRCITSHLAQKPDYVTWHFEERVIYFAIVTIMVFMMCMMMMMVYFEERVILFMIIMVCDAISKPA